MEGGANVKTTLTAEVLKCAFSGFDVNEDVATKGDDWSGIVVEETI